MGTSDTQDEQEPAPTDVLDIENEVLDFNFSDVDSSAVEVVLTTMISYVLCAVSAILSCSL